jgi:glyoxylase-like metal-dependent hydrolase (beta-lactamase superfamily II)
MSLLSVDFLRVGQCRHLECMAARGGRWGLVDFPSCCALIRHPQAGWILFDTGYAEHFFTATRQLPERLYAMALPVNLPPEEHLLAQLAKRGLSAADIKMVVVSHYHGDHVAGLKDFPAARFVASRRDSEIIRRLGPWRASFQGQLHRLLPENYWQRLSYAEDLKQIPLPEWMAPFTQGWDLLGDSSLLLLPLPGHSKGQLGLLLPETERGPVLLAADACWSLPACREGRLPSPLVRFFTADPAAYRQTFSHLGELARRETSLHILPSHCAAAASCYGQEPSGDSYQ